MTITSKTNPQRTAAGEAASRESRAPTRGDDGGTSGVHKRSFDRHFYELEVDLQSEHNFYTGISLNISEGGLFVATHMTKPVGTQVALRFRLPNDPDPIEVMADVRWSRAMGDDSSPGLGLRFQNLPENTARRIQAFMRAMRDPIYYDE